MVSVAQLVERWIVIPVVVGSSPIVHPIPFYLFLISKWFGFKCLMNPSRLKFPLKIHLDSNS